VPEKEDERKVEDVDKPGERFVRRRWSREWLSPLNYHL